jgi:hypothetical protein
MTATVVPGRWSNVGMSGVDALVVVIAVNNLAGSEEIPATG